MNNLLELKGRKFTQKDRVVKGAGFSMNGNYTVTKDTILQVLRSAQHVKNFWEKEKKSKNYFEGILVTAFYNKIAAKSNRINGLLKGEQSNYSIVGAKFNDTRNKHIITYLVDEKDLTYTIDLLDKTEKILQEFFPNGINKNLFEQKEKFNIIPYNKFHITKTCFRRVVADTSFLEKFDVLIDQCLDSDGLVTLYNTNQNLEQILQKIGIAIQRFNIIDQHTVFLYKDQIAILKDKAPYLISMSTIDLSLLSPDSFSLKSRAEAYNLPTPLNEPIIGVIDTLFDSKVYFGPWVEYYDLVDKNIPRSDIDYMHGTAIDSIIIDGPRLNPWLDDGCGYFRVRHFGVALNERVSSFTLIKRIREIVELNQDIRVWNLSLGSHTEISDNYISPVAALLDQLQDQYNIIFVVSGTNKLDDNTVKIGSPADSINSIVVNSVTRSRQIPLYARRGPALSFFAKPDISYFGGDSKDPIFIYTPQGRTIGSGTSYATPWISRKLAYLIDIMGFSREIAKALIIDAARGWSESPSPIQMAFCGHGIVPINIKDIIQSKDNEIKFFVQDISEKWNTYNYSFPVPLVDDKYPYIAKATMCYFPKTNRSQGVDYTNTELNLHFGRINDKGLIDDIKGDTQNQDHLDEDDKCYLYERIARGKFRKWDNVKYIVECPKTRNMPKRSYQKTKNWGMEIKTNNRLNPNDGKGIKFGVVVTLKEIKGVNRIDEFIKNCILNGWLVSTVDVKQRIKINQKLSEEINFD